MLRYAIVRTSYGVIAFLAVTIILYGFFRAIYNPVDLFWMYHLEKWERAKYEIPFSNFDAWITGYFKYIGYILHGDLGLSFKWPGSTAAELVALHMPASLALSGVAGGIGIFLAVGLGVMGIAKPGSLFDLLGNVLAVITRATPTFVVSILLVWVFADILGWVPPKEKGDLVAWILPGATLVLSTMGMLPLLRSAMYVQVSSNHVKLARIHGLPEWKIAWKHAFRNAGIVPLASFGPAVATFIGSVLVVEYIFAWPGLGMLTLQAFFARDYYVVHAVLLLVAFALIFIHVAVDIALAFADPRIRFPKMREYAEMPATL